MHLGMSHSEVYRLPVPYRKWNIKRLIKHFEKKNENYEKNKKASSPKKESEAVHDFDMNKFRKFEDLVSSKI